MKKIKKKILKCKVGLIKLKYSNKTKKKEEKKRERQKKNKIITLCEIRT